MVNSPNKIRIAEIKTKDILRESNVALKASNH